MSNIVIFIGEGVTEYYFVHALLLRIYGINQDIKDSKVLQIGDDYLIFGHPMIGKTNHRGGDHTFMSSSTYKLMFSIIQNNQYLLSSGNGRYQYLIMTDNDTGKFEDKISFAEKEIKKFSSLYHGPIICGNADPKIENRFLLGIGENIKSIYPKFDNKEFLKIKKKILHNSSYCVNKEEMGKILGEKWLPTTVGNNFGLYIDIDEAKRMSSSFASFMENIESLFGLSTPT